MLNCVRWLPVLGAVLLLLLTFPGEAGAHAALSRSEPTAGSVLAQSPVAIRLWFTEPLEQSYTGAELFDAAGEAVAGTSFAIAPEDPRLLVVMPPDLADGGYVVSWRTLSAADGHTLQGYFGFRVGDGATDEFVAPPTDSSGVESARALTRGVALLGLAALIAIAPMMVGVLGPVARMTPVLTGAMLVPLRRYALFAVTAALLGSVVALGAQAAAVVPDESLAVAMWTTLTETRYGQLWMLRLALLSLCSVTVALALWGREFWRRPAALAGSGLAIAAPLPFSLLSHAAAQQEGRAAAIAADTLHLLAASVWVGGLFMLALVLLPALRPLPVGQRWQVLRTVFAQFSAIGLAAWAVLILSGLYATWLQVGTPAAIWETSYGQTLLLKAALLLPVLALAAFHLGLGRSKSKVRGNRLGVTLVIEALLVVGVMLVVGRLIGLEPAREALMGRTPPQIVVPLAFATPEEARDGRLIISPGATGSNTFTLEIDGPPLPGGTEGVLRFALADRALGAQELLLPAAGQNQFRADGSELALSGAWRIEAVVRAIGAFSWSSQVIVRVDESPPPVPPVNPSPRFAPMGIIGMIAIVIGIAALAAVVSRGALESRRRGVAALGAVALAVGGVVLFGSLIPAAAPVQPAMISQNRPSTVASPAEVIHHEEMMDHGLHSTPVLSTPAADPLPGPGTPVSGDGLTVTIAAEPISAGPTDVSIEIADEDESPLTEARVVVLSDMPGMAMGRIETPAEETDPGRYTAELVPLGMSGEWRLGVRVSPRGASTQVFSFAVQVP